MMRWSDVRQRWASGTLKGEEDKLLEMILPRNPRQAAYLHSSTKDLRKMCNDRKLRTAKDSSRAELIGLLEGEDHRSRSWVESKSFEIFYLCIIVLNASVIGWEIDHPDSLEIQHFAWLNLGFLMFFIAEIILKVHALGWRRYIQDYWNIFDVTVTLLAATQICSTYILLTEFFYTHLKQYIAGDCIEILRLCRLLRFARVFPELGRLIRSFFLSLKALFWVFVLLALWFYLSGCFATIFVGRRGFLPSEDHDEIRALRSKFATIPLSMFALFEIMTLEGWVDYVRPLLHTRPHLVVFFLIFIFITAFFMLNLVTAVIVDRTKAAQDEELEVEAQQAQLERRVHINEICEALRNREASPQERDLLGDEDFDATVKTSDDIAGALRELGWSKRYLISLYNCLDQSADGRTSISALQKLLEISDKPLDTANYMRFQLSLSHRLEHQEKLILRVLGVLEDITDQKFEVPVYPAHSRKTPV